MERLSWDEVCAKYPNQWVVLAEADWVQDTDEEFGTALVLGHYMTRNDASSGLETLSADFSELACFYAATNRRHDQPLRAVRRVDRRAGTQS